MISYFKAILKDLEKMEGFDGLPFEVQEKILSVAACLVSVQVCQVFFECLSQLQKEGKFTCKK